MENVWTEADKGKAFKYIGDTTKKPLTIADFILLNSKNKITIPKNAILKDGIFYLLTADNNLVALVTSKLYYEKVKSWNLIQKAPNIDLTKLEAGKKYKVTANGSLPWEFTFQETMVLNNGQYNLQLSNWGYLPNGTIENPPSPNFMAINQIFVYD